MSRNSPLKSLRCGRGTAPRTKARHAAAYWPLWLKKKGLKSPQGIKIHHWKLDDEVKTEVALMLLQAEEFKPKLRTHRKWFAFISSQQYSLKTRVNNIQHLNSVFRMDLLVAGSIFWCFISPVLSSLPSLSFGSLQSEIRHEHLFSAWGDADKISGVLSDSSHSKITLIMSWILCFPCCFTASWLQTVTWVATRPSAGWI